MPPAVIQLDCNQTLASVMHQGFHGEEEIRCDEAGSVWQTESWGSGGGSLNEMIQYCYENLVRRGLVKWARDYLYWWDVE